MELVAIAVIVGTTWLVSATGFAFVIGRSIKLRDRVR